MKNTLLAFSVALLSSLHLFAQEYMGYESLDKTDPIDFRGDHIRYKGHEIALNETAFFVDGRLSDADVARYPFVFNSLNEALKQLKDGSESSPMTLYIAPYVYWIDDPDDPAVREPVTGSIPYGQIVKCRWLKFYGLTDDPVHVVLACRRGQTQGAAGNFTMFYFDGDGIRSENITFGNYCNVDLEYPLLPELNRSKRSSTVTQAQLIICNSDKVLARNTRFISRLNLCPFAGAKRALFDGCYFESTDDALCGTGVYLNSRFVFFSSKPFYHTQGAGAVFLNCDFDVRTKQKQYLTKVSSPVAIVDSRFESYEEPLYLGWTQDPSDDLRCYQYNVSLNGAPVLINAGKPEVTIDMTGKPVLDAYRLDDGGEVIYNTYNLLRGDDDWDPMGVKHKVLHVEERTGKKLTRIPTYLRISPSSASIESGVSAVTLHAEVKRFGNYAYDGEILSWSVRPEDQQVVRLKEINADDCEAEGVNDREETKQVIVNAVTPGGLSSASVLTVAPRYLDAPGFISMPRIVKQERGRLKVDYELNLEGREDQSLITWYRCSKAEGLCTPVLVSRLDRPEYTYALSDADLGYDIRVEVAPKHLRCHPGKPVSAITEAPVGKEDFDSGRTYYTDFRNFPTDPQFRIIPGFWTVDRYKPAGLEAYPWGEPVAGAWYYGKGSDGMKGYGLIQREKGARLLYTPVEGDYGDMSVTLNVDPGKTAGQGFGSATGQFLEIYIKYDTRSLTGYGLRIIRTTKYDHAVDFILMRYENGIAVPVSEPVSSTCYRTDCTIELKVEGNRLTAHAETTTEVPGPVAPGLQKTVDLRADILPGRFGGTGVQHTGSTGANATMLHWLQIDWKDEPLTPQGGRSQIDLSSASWNITLDGKAGWENDTLYLPPVDIHRLPVHLPTGGWRLLETPDKENVTLPATVEGHLWDRRGDSFGVNGNYVGVSWFTTKVFIPAEWKGKNLFLKVGSVRFRAEIFVNRQLAGYDPVNSTPFDVNITAYAKYGAENEIAFRITDPNGNFNWKDSQVYTWGRYFTNPTHGFGGITGKVSLVATDRVFVEDVFVKNQPNPVHVEVEMVVRNLTKKEEKKDILLEVFEYGTDKRVYAKTYSSVSCPEGASSHVYALAVPGAKLWSVDSPALYTLSVTVGEDKTTQRFGFRWFEVRDVKGDRQFYLNGKRIVLRTAISWSFWPDNGIAPTDELARRQVQAAKDLGLNMLNFHRAIGQPAVLDCADELGLLYYEEPGGNQYPANRFNDNNMQSRFYFGYRNEKLTRMIRRDRNHPSLIIYNMHNERGAYPQAEDYRQMRMGHELDPTRIFTYNSSNGENPLDKPDARFKLHLTPNDTTFRDYGWWDRHHAGGPGVYHDHLYTGKDNYHRFSDHKDEIIFWGEDGAIGTPPRLQLIREEIMRTGRTDGWEAADYLEWYDAYERFLKEKRFDRAFPTVDHLTRAMGNVAYYYQGRAIENIRISNTVDGYAVNGWESMKLENHSGIVDNYRNPKGDVEWIARYNRPLFLSVKMNRKALSVGDTTIVDVYIVNEENIRGNHLLRLTARDREGNVLSTVTRKVKVEGGVCYGQNLMTGWVFVPGKAGYITIEAELLNGRKVITRGDDTLFAVRLNTGGISANGSVADTTGVLQRFMRTAGFDLPAYKGGAPTGDYLLVGAFEPQQWGSGMSDIMEWVYKGHTLIIVDNPERWAEFLADKEVLDYRGSKALGRSWYGGNFFNRRHPVFEGLPSDCAFNWEYQCFAAYNRRRIGLRIVNGETLVGCVSDHKKEVYSALTIVPAGSGKVIITTLDIPSCIRDVSAYSAPVDVDGMNESMNTFNTSGGNRANVVGQQLLLNLLKR